MSAIKPISFTIPTLQNELKDCILKNEEAKTKQLITDHPILLNLPFADGSLPLHVAIDSHQTGIARQFIAMSADPIKKDSENLDGYDHAYIAGENALGVWILQGINKQIPHSILLETVALRSTLAIIKQQVAALISSDAKDAIAEQANKRNSANWTLLEVAIDSHNTSKFLQLLVCGADPKQKTHDGNSLLHKALSENQIQSAHALLFAGLDPNEPNTEGQTPLSVAAASGNMRAVYLLLAYGAKLTAPIAETLANVARRHDPLHIDSADTWFFLTTGAYWLAKGCMDSADSNIPALIHLLGATWVLYSQLPKTSGLWKQATVITGLVGMQMLPGCNVAMQAWKAAAIARSAFSGIKAVYNNCVNRPWQALQKGVVHSVNVLQSLYATKNTAAYEYNQSELVKELYRGNGITPEILSEYAHWNCDNFKKLFRIESLKQHPDKSQDPASSTIQTALNAVNNFWKNYCTGRQAKA